MSEVFYIKDISKFGSILSERFSRIYKKGDRIGVKVHFGEPGNPYTFKPEFLSEFVFILKNIGLEPFLFDSPVVYSSPRNSVKGYCEVLKNNGFSEKKMKCPLIISNNSKKIPGRVMDFKVCSDMINCDGQIILSHLKGHIATGFGAAIKNIGMGCMDRETKGLIHHGGKPVYKGGCVECGECVDNCPTSHIRIYMKKPVFDRTFCCGCSNCSYICPEDCIGTVTDYFDELLVEAAASGIGNYKKPYYINCIFDIAERCDCDSDPGEKLSDDAGIVFGDDIVAVEKASYDLLLKMNGHDVFEEVHHISPLRHIKIAERMGLGSMDYNLVEV